MEVTDRNIGVGWKECCELLVIPRDRNGAAAIETSSDDESQAGPLELTGLLARGL